MINNNISKILLIGNASVRDIILQIEVFARKLNGEDNLMLEHINAQ